MHSPTPSDNDMVLDESIYDVTESMVQDNPFNPPRQCAINTLPDELLVYIMELGAENDYEDSDDDLLHNYLESSDYADDDEEVYVQDGKLVDKDSLPIVEDDEDDSEWEEEEEMSGSGSDSGSGSEMTTDDDEDNPPTLPFPVLCSHVCSRWRLLAIETPSFWTKLDFGAGLPLSRAIAVIERSKGLPLDINIDLDGEDESEEGSATDSEAESAIPVSLDFDEGKTMPGQWGMSGKAENSESEDGSMEESPMEDLDEILNIIIPEVHRWRTLHMTSNLYENLYKVLEAVEKFKDAPILEDLDLRCYTEGDDLESPLPEQYNKRFVPFSANTPRLRFLALFEAAVDWEGCMPMFTHLQKLEIAHHSPDRCPSYEQFQRMSANCVDLQLRHSGPFPIPPSAAVTELPLLKDFTLAVHESRYAEALYPLLVMPNVTRLVLDCSEEDYSSFGQTLALGSNTNPREKSLLSRLEELRVDGFPCSRATKREMVQQLGQLHTLQLYSYDDEFEFLEVLMEAAGENGAHCPKLKKVLSRSIAGNIMKSFVEARKGLGVPVESVFMAKHDDVDRDEHEWLKNNVHFGYFSPSDSEEELEEVSDDDLSLLI